VEAASPANGVYRRRRDDVIGVPVEQVEERRRAEEILRQAQKMSVLGQLTSGIAHDFNNMLSVIIGSLEILERRLGTDDPKIHSSIRLAVRCAERSAGLTSLLAFARLEPLDPKPVDANSLITGMSGLLGLALGEAIPVETSLAAGLWSTSTDLNQLENALLNLAINARDAMPDGGTLTFETANIEFDKIPDRARPAGPPDQYVMIAVSDTGTGMSKDVMEKVFEPFFTTKPPGHGTGLGLSQVQSFVRQSGGHIQLWSEPGRGTTIKLYLPRYLTATSEGRAHEPSGAKTERPAIPPLRSQAEQILVVEDDELLLASVTTMLEELGYSVLSASDGATALRLLAATPAVRLMLTDIGLPGRMNGWQLSNEARRNRPDLLVLYTTGYPRNAVIHRGRLEANTELICKPFAPAALLCKIESLLEQAQSGRNDCPGWPPADR
jgi:nitrogen-specific signal transduction histidine kinase